MASALASPDAKSQGLSRKERRELKEKAREQARADELEPLGQKFALDDVDEQLEAARELRTLLNGTHAPPLESVIQAGFLPRLLQLSQCDAHRDLQFEALWILTDMTRGTAEQVRAVIDDSALDALKHLLDSPVAAAREQAVTILANAAGASSELRDLVLRSGAVPSIMKLAKGTPDAERQTQRGGAQPLPISVMRMAARCLSCLCQGEPCPFSGDAAKPLFQTLETLIMSSDDDILVKACSALACLRYKATDQVTQLLKNGVCARLIDLFSHPSDEVQLSAVRAAVKTAVGSRQGLDAIMQCQPVPALKDMLSSESSMTLKVSCSMLANILALGSPCVQDVIDEGCPQLLVGLLHTGDDEVKRAAARALGVLSSRCSPEQLKIFVGSDAIAPMVAMLETAAFQSLCEVARTALIFIESVLKAGRRLGTDTFERMLKDADGARMLEAVPEMSNDKDLCARAKAIREIFF